MPGAAAPGGDASCASTAAEAGDNDVAPDADAPLPPPPPPPLPPAAEGAAGDVAAPALTLCADGVFTMVGGDSVAVDAGAAGGGLPTPGLAAAEDAPTARDGCTGDARALACPRKSAMVLSSPWQHPARLQLTTRSVTRAHADRPQSC